MKKLFTAIRKGDIETVRELLEKKPELISCTAKQPPKQDDGQSPLQVAIKSGQFEIAHLLLDLGADLDYIRPGFDQTIRERYAKEPVSRFVK